MISESCLYDTMKGKVNIALLQWPQVSRKHSSRFSRNSEASASEFLENLEEMFPRYYMNIYQQAQLFNHTQPSRKSWTIIQMTLTSRACSRCDKWSEEISKECMPFHKWIWLSVCSCDEHNEMILIHQSDDSQQITNRQLLIYSHIVYDINKCQSNCSTCLYTASSYGIVNIAIH